jgi:hypothetical protein
MEKLIDTLYYCAAQCNTCYTACQGEPESHHLERCMSLDRDCEDICRLAGQFLERQSENSHLLLKLCGQVCEKCAAECEKHKHQHCLDCARACRECASLCLEDQHIT